MRIHQEDLCQAMGLEPGRKYQRSGPLPSFAAMAEVLAQWARPEERWRLFDLMLPNVCLGNADGHAKSYALLHPPNAPIRLAPAHDVMCTLHDERVPTAMGLRVDGVADLTAVTLGDLIAEGVEWGLPRDAVRQRARELMDRLPDAIADAAAQVPPPTAVLTARERHQERMLR